MKIQITMKPPDCLEYAIDEQFETAMENAKENNEELYEIEDEKAEILNKCKKWFQYGELVTLEIDTEKDTCVVVENY